MPYLYGNMQQISSKYMNVTNPSPGQSYELKLKKIGEAAYTEQYFMVSKPYHTDN